MNKTFLFIGIGVVLLLGVSVGSYYYITHPKKPLPPPCPTDVMMCPDGSSVPRSGPDCGFGICAQELPSYIETPPQVINIATTTETTATPTVFQKVSRTTSSVIRKVTSLVTGTTSSPTPSSTSTQETKPTIALPEGKTTPTPPQTTLNETRYHIKNNTIVDDNNVVLYTIPKVSNSSTVGGMENHIVNAVEVGTTPPIIGAIPVDGTPGKYYLSENAFGDITKCEFSNRVYILDTKTNTKTLMYEENSTTLSSDDPRACNSEIYLLATNAEKLVFKYHTVQTNMTCDSTWSEPDKTWYLDVTKLDTGSKRYYIAPALYTEAEQKEEACRAQMATSTPQTDTSSSTING